MGKLANIEHIVGNMVYDENSMRELANIIAYTIFSGALLVFEGAKHHFNEIALWPNATIHSVVSLAHKFQMTLVEFITENDVNHLVALFFICFVDVGRFYSAVTPQICMYLFAHLLCYASKPYIFK